MRHLLLKYTIALVIFIFSNTTQAQESKNSKSNNSDFNFWLGTWDVYKYGTDTIVGLSEITSILNHKTIEENYQSTKYPYRGTSYNTYNSIQERWEQFWVDNSGYTLHIKGGLENEKMVLSHCDGKICNKIQWTPLTDGSVRQEWLQSKDTGETWNKVFDGHYKKVKSEKSITEVLQQIKNYPNVRDFTISSDRKEAYITVQSPTEEIRTICRMVKTKNSWSQPSPASFSGTHKDLEPYLSPDNLRLYFASARHNDSEKEDYDIYYVEREHKDSVWSSPINVGSPINSTGDEFYPAIASSGNLYFTSTRTGTQGKDDIFYSKLENGKYLNPSSISTGINTEGYEFNSYIAPDESYLIFSGYNRLDGLGSGDMYISYRDSEGNWGNAENLGPKINSKFMDYCPYVDVQKGELYFTSRRSDIQTSKIVNNFELERAVLQYQNGTSRIYKMNFKK